MASVAVMSGTSAHSPEANSNIRLDSWKEIAAYLKCGVRTVQRWEKTEGLPVHRHLHQNQGSIYAFTSEIDEWRTRRSAKPTGRVEQGPGKTTPEPLVGRLSELARLQDSWSRASAGSRQIVFVSGTIGIGKTALVRAFLESLDEAWIIEGQCVEQYGSGEPYLPVLEGLARLVRRSRHHAPATVMAKYAPSWVAHIPDFPPGYSAGTGAADPRAESMVRELIDALEALARDRPVVFALEDLHWADRSTVELVDRIARRADSARVLVLGTHRLEEWVDREPPLLRVRHELEAHALCRTVRVPPLPEEVLAEHLTRRGRWSDLPAAARYLHRWTGGVPLFVNIVVDDLIETNRLRLGAEGWTLIESARKALPPVAPMIRDLIDDRLRRLDADEQRLLEAASVAGYSFRATALAAALRLELTEVERTFESLARRHQFVERQADDTSGGMTDGSYGFLHSLYQQVVYDRISPTARAALHREIALFLEGLYRDGRDDLSAELATHFERSGDVERAATYYEAAAATALGRGASYEAQSSALKALEQLARLTPSPDRDLRELNVRLKICAAVTNIATMGDPEVGRAYADTAALCERLGDSAHIVPALLGIARFHSVRGDVALAGLLSERALAISNTMDDPVHRALSLHHLGVSWFAAGRIADSHQMSKEAADLGLALASDATLFTSGYHVSPAARLAESHSAWFLGYPTRAVSCVRRAVATAESLRHPQTISFTKGFGVVVLAACGLYQQGLEWIDASLTLARQCELPFAIIFAEGVRGWIVGATDYARGVEDLTRALELQASIGMDLWLPMMNAWLAQILLRAGDVAGAAAAVDAGLRIGGDRGITFYDAELYGLQAEVLAAARARRGTVTANGDPAEEPVEFARKAYAIAQAQGAKAFELRTAVRLVRLATTEAAAGEARALLAATYASFTEGFDTPDLQAAKALL